MNPNMRRLALILAFPLLLGGCAVGYVDGVKARCPSFPDFLGCPAGTLRVCSTNSEGCKLCECVQPGAR